MWYDVNICCGEWKMMYTYRYVVMPMHKSSSRYWHCLQLRVRNSIRARGTSHMYQRNVLHPLKLILNTKRRQAWKTEKIKRMMHTLSYAASHSIAMDGWCFLCSVLLFFLPLSVHLLFWCSPASLCFIEYGRISVPVAFFIITLVACICKAFERRLQRCLLHSVSSRASRRTGVGIVCNG